MTVPVRRSAVLAAATAVSAAALAGCAAASTSSAPAGGGAASSSASATPSTAGSSTVAASSGTASAPAAPATASPAAGQASGSAPPPACSTAQLQASLGGGAGAGMSQLHTGLQLRNVGHAPCSLEGFPGVSWVTGSSGQQAGPAAARQAPVNSASASTVTLAPGGLASAPLDIVQGDGGLPASQCHPVSARGLRVYPPGQKAALFISDPVQDPGVCSVRTTAPMLTVGFMQSGAQPGNGGGG